MTIQIRKEKVIEFAKAIVTLPCWWGIHFPKRMGKFDGTIVETSCRLCKEDGIIDGFNFYPMKKE